MSLVLSAVTLNSNDPERTAEFWSEALDGEVVDGGNGYMHIRSAGLILIVQHSPGRGSTVATDVHLDLRATDPTSEVLRLQNLGATVLAHRRDSHGRWTVMRDPDGREFCVA